MAQTRGHSGAVGTSAKRRRSRGRLRNKQVRQEGRATGEEVPVVWPRRATGLTARAVSNLAGDDESSATATGMKVAPCCRRRDVSRYAEQISTNTFGNEKGATVAHAEVEKWCKSLPRAVVEELMLDANDLGVSAVVRRAALRSCQSTGPSSDPQENEAR